MVKVNAKRNAKFTGRAAAVKPNQPRTSQSASVNPFDALPAELISHIFMIRLRDFLHDDDHDDEWEDSTQGSGASSAVSDKPELKKPQLVVSSVCRRFRNIALATPMLWSQIEIFTAPESSEMFLWTILCIERSGSCPLDMQLDFSSEVDDPDEAPYKSEDVDKLMEILLPHISRWRELWVVVDFLPMCMRLLWHLRDQHAPMLEELSLFTNEDVDELVEGPPEPARLPSGFAPSLTKLEVWSVPLHWATFPFENLVTLDISYLEPSASYSYADLCGILGASPNLQELALRGPRIGLDDIPSPPDPFQITLHNLGSLRISGAMAPVDFILVINLIAAPKLETLILQQLVDDNFEAPLVLLGSSPDHARYRTVTKLQIDGVEIYGNSDVAHLRMFRAMPDITHLFIDCSQIEDYNAFTVLRRVAKDGSSEPVLPRLKTLQVNDVPSEVLIDVLDFRKEAGLPVQTLLLNSSGHWDVIEIRNFAKRVDVDFYDPSDDEYESTSEEDEDDDGSDLSELSDDDAFWTSSGSSND